MAHELGDIDIGIGSKGIIYFISIFLCICTRERRLRRLERIEFEVKDKIIVKAARESSCVYICDYEMKWIEFEMKIVQFGLFDSYFVIELNISAIIQKIHENMQ